MKRISPNLTYGIVLVIVLSIGCGEDPPTGDSAISIAGTVIDSVSRVPLDSVAIVVEDSSQVIVFTDSVGQYTFTIWGSRTAVFAVKAGYHTKSKAADNSTAPAVVDFELVPE